MLKSANEFVVGDRIVAYDSEEMIRYYQDDYVVSKLENLPNGNLLVIFESGKEVIFLPEQKTNVAYILKNPQ